MAIPGSSENSRVGFGTPLGYTPSPMHQQRVLGASPLSMNFANQDPISFDEFGSSSADAQFLGAPPQNSFSATRAASAISPLQVVQNATHEMLIHNHIYNTLIMKNISLEAEIKAVRSSFETLSKNVTTATTTTGQLLPSTTSFIQLEQEDFPLVTIWTLQQYKKTTKKSDDAGIHQTTLGRGKNKDPSALRDSMKYLQNSQGLPVNEARAREICDQARRIWQKLLQHDMAPRKWKQVTPPARDYYHSEMYKHFDEFRYCGTPEHWKAERLATEIYPGWARWKFEKAATGVKEELDEDTELLVRKRKEAPTASASMKAMKQPKMDVDAAMHGINNITTASIPQRATLQGTPPNATSTTPKVDDELNAAVHKIPSTLSVTASSLTRPPTPEHAPLDVTDPATMRQSTFGESIAADGASSLSHSTLELSMEPVQDPLVGAASATANDIAPAAMPLTDNIRETTTLQEGDSHPPTTGTISTESAKVDATNALPTATATGNGAVAGISNELSTPQLNTPQPDLSEATVVRAGDGFSVGSGAGSERRPTVTGNRKVKLIALKDPLTYSQTSLEPSRIAALKSIASDGGLSPSSTASAPIKSTEPAPTKSTTAASSTPPVPTPATPFKFAPNNNVEWNLFGAEYSKTHVRPSKQEVKSAYEKLSAGEKQVWSTLRKENLNKRKADRGKAKAGAA